jgi:hypothetical protein
MWKSKKTVSLQLTDVQESAIALKEQGPVQADTLVGVGLVDRGTIGGGVDCIVFSGVEYLVRRHRERKKATG